LLLRLFILPSSSCMRCCCSGGLAKHVTPAGPSGPAELCIFRPLHVKSPTVGHKHTYLCEEMGGTGAVYQLEQGQTLFRPAYLTRVPLATQPLCVCKKSGA
jgi:hypothetical protein